MQPRGDTPTLSQLNKDPYEATKGSECLKESYLRDENLASQFAKKKSSTSKTQPLKPSEFECTESMEKIEAARFDFFMFKQHMFDLFDEFKGNHSRVQAVRPSATSPHLLLDSTLREKLREAESKLDKLEVHFEHLASMAEKSEKLNQQNRTQKKQSTELAKSLKEIEFTYQKSKNRLERDLNKMESQIN